MGLSRQWCLLGQDSSANSRLRKKGFRGAVRAAGMTAMSLDEASPGWSDRLRRPRTRGL